MPSKKRVLIAVEKRKEYGYLDPTVQPQDVHVKRSERQIESSGPGAGVLDRLKRRKKPQPTKEAEDFLKATERR